MKQTFRLALLIPCMAVTCWYGMMLVHECGHMLAALLTGATIERLEFPLLGFSRTDVSPGAHPLMIVWCGPLFGAVSPLAVWGILTPFRKKMYILHVFAAFCLLANGLYIGIGSFARIGDAGDLLRLHSSLWTLWLFGAAASAGGLLMFHGLGPRLGIFRARSTDLAIAILGAVALIGLSLVLQAQ